MIDRVSTEESKESNRDTDILLQHLKLKRKIGMMGRWNMINSVLSNLKHSSLSTVAVQCPLIDR